MSGVAPDGGLYLPERWPTVSAGAQSRFGAMPFAEVAADVLSLFAGKALSDRELKEMTTRAFAAFDTPLVAPLRRIDDDTHLLELFHGPTLAFKDLAMRMLAEFYDWALEGHARGKTIIGATSGDTGGAAVSAFGGSPSAEIFMLHPKGRISDVQRRLMTTSTAANIVNIAIDGSFDDCQRIVKLLFADERLNRSFDLGAVNSINFMRIAVQAVYYFTAAASLGRPATFVVPTGNFGDAFAGHAARSMGLSVVRIVAAVNRNDVVKHAITTGVYQPTAVVPTSSPSMDIQAASNFERLIFETSGRDGRVVSDLMATFERDRRMTVPDEARRAIAGVFSAESAADSEVDAMMRAFQEKHGAIIDPHTAVGLVACAKLRSEGVVEGPVICLATAHPAKFPDAVRRACGVAPALPLRHQELMKRKERLTEAPADAAVVRAIIENRSRFC